MSLPSNILAALTRRSTAFRRRHSGIRHWVPVGLVRGYTRAKCRASRWRGIYMRVESRSAYDNLFHCCVHKSGSQWIRSILTDPVVFRYSGLAHHHYQSFRPETRPTHERTFAEPFPGRSIVTPLYITYENYAALPKSGSARAFFVVRDPRDLIVSWYYSTRKTHAVDPSSEQARVRDRLLELPKEEALAFAVDFWEERGRFRALRSWLADGAADPDVRLVRYEDLIGRGSSGEFRSLFDFLDIRIPEAPFRSLLEAYSFERLSGRKRGEEDTGSHLRSAEAEGWRQHLTTSTVDYLDEVTDKLPTALGYAT